MKQIFIHKNFLDEKTLKDLNSYLSNADHWERDRSLVWDSRCINLINMQKQTQDLMLSISKDVTHVVSSSHNPSNRLYFDIFQFVRWREGLDYLHPHADSENPDKSPHPFFYREYSCVIYLNDNYEGGKIYFPNFNNYSPETKAGTLITFPGTLEYLHGVTPVTKGNRYTIASFFTSNKKYSCSFSRKNYDDQIN